MPAHAVRLVAAAALAAVSFAASASAQSSGIGFTFVPKHIVQGENARVSVKVRPSGARCTLAMRYQGGGGQPGLPAAIAAGGVATWTWRVPESTQAGPAVATVRCARGGAATRSIVIVGRLVEPKITVTKQGYSIRPNPSTGSRLSYGLILHNDSATKDALNVTVQVNFVMGDNNLLGTDSQRIDGISAGSDFALGHMVNFPAAAPITRLEVVIQVEHYQPAALHNPTLANMHLLPQLYDPNWVGTVEGEIQNTDPLLTLQGANVFAVVFDSAGNIVGGGSGFAYQPLPPGARQFIQLGMGFDAIPIDHAASTMVSMTSTWKQPGS